MSFACYFRGESESDLERNTAIFKVDEGVWKLAHLHQS